MLDHFLRSHPKLDALMLRLFPHQRLWISARYEWSVGRTFNDGPDEYYWPWKVYWEYSQGDYGKAECAVCSEVYPDTEKYIRNGVCHSCMATQPWLFRNMETGEFLKPPRPSRPSRPQWPEGDKL